MTEYLAPAVFIRYLIQALDQLIPRFPSYAKLATAALLSAASAQLGVIHAPADIQQALPQTAPLIGAAILWALTDLSHTVINLLEGVSKKP